MCLDQTIGSLHAENSVMGREVFPWQQVMYVSPFGVVV